MKKKKLFQKPKYFLVVDGYDPRIHALYFCPQLYRKEDGDLVPLSGQEIGQLMAQALEGGAIEKSPWYEPSGSLRKNQLSGLLLSLSLIVLSSIRRVRVQMNRLYCALAVPEREKVKTQLSRALSEFAPARSMLSVTDSGAVVGRPGPQEPLRSHHQSFQADEPQSVASTDRELVEVMAILHGSMTGEANFTIIRYDFAQSQFRGRPSRRTSVFRKQLV